MLECVEMLGCTGWRNNMTDLVVTWYLADPSAKLPVRATKGSAGYDLFACKNVTVPPFESVLVPTGIKLCMQTTKPFYLPEAQVRPRSGLALKHGITVLNTPGTIDSDYEGEIGVVLYNTRGSEFTIGVGDRIAQLVFNLIPIPYRENVINTPEEFAMYMGMNKSIRGNGGFGSTGES